MKLRLIKSMNNSQKQILEISTNQSKIAIGFGEEISTGEILEDVNPMIDGLTVGAATYDGMFILRNPENCNIADYVLDEIPIYLDQKLKKSYDICNDFLKLKQRNNVVEMRSFIKINDLRVTYFLIDNSNTNTSILFVESEGKSICISGDFRNFDSVYNQEKLNKCLEIIKKADYWFLDGSFIGKSESNVNSEDNLVEKLKNIVKFYKQVFVIQSETDLSMAKRFYEVALKTKRIFIENTFLANLASEAMGSSPNPITSKKVYTYTPLVLDNRDFDFKQKYISHFYIHDATDNMKKEKYIMNINVDMYQDLQVFEKKNVMYDACVIFAMNKKYLKTNKELEEFINLISEFDMDYYEIYTTGKFDHELINQIVLKLKPKKVIPINFNPDNNSVSSKMYNFKALEDDEVIEV